MPPSPRYENRMRENVAYLQGLIAQLSGALSDEGPAWSTDGLRNLRTRVANALPPDKRPDWLHPYADPAMTAGLSAARRVGEE